MDGRVREGRCVDSAEKSALQTMLATC
jgi:hypothetical protein